MPNFNKLLDVHPEPPIAYHMSPERLQFTGQELDPAEGGDEGSANAQQFDATYTVDFPAPLAPTIAMRESKPTSRLTPFKRILSGVYPKVISDICNRGGDIFSVSGNLVGEK